MRYLTRNVLQQQQTLENFPIFVRLVSEKTACTIPRDLIRQIDREGKSVFRNGDFLKSLYLKFFAAAAYELRGYNKEAAICYNYAAKSCHELELTRERMSMLKRCAYSYIAIDTPDFLNAGFAFLKASTCDEDRTEMFRDLKRAEQSFICAGKDIERDEDIAKLYREILQEIHTPTLNEKLLTKIMATPDCTDLELLISEIIFARKSEFSRGRIDRLRDENINIPVDYPKEKILLNALVGRGYELMNPAVIKNVFAANAYEHGANCAFSHNMNPNGVDLCMRSAQNWLRARDYESASKNLQRASHYARPVFREELAKIADSVIQPKPL